MQDMMACKLEEICFFVSWFQKLKCGVLWIRMNQVCCSALYMDKLEAQKTINWLIKLETNQH